MGIQSDFQQWHGINEVEDDGNDDRDLTTCVQGPLCNLAKILIGLDDIALLVTAETGPAPNRACVYCLLLLL